VSFNKKRPGTVNKTHFFLLTAASMRGDYILAGVSLLVTATISGGLINGWGPIHSMLQNERNCKGKCSPEIEDEFQAIFQSGFIALSVTSTLFGLAVDRFGPRVTVLCGISMSVVGNILFALSDWDKFNAFSWGYALIGGGGIAPFLCHFNFANYFENGLKYVTAVNTMFNLAGVVYLLISAFEFPRREFFLVYAGICAAFGIAAAFLYPDKVAQRNSVYNYPRINCFSTNDAESETEKQDLIKKDSELQNYWSKIKPDMFSRPFILLVVWYSLNLLITGWVSSTLRIF
jgi:MFS family permease